MVILSFYHNPKYKDYNIQLQAERAIFNKKHKKMQKGTQK
jgi:hypothetical protein